MPKLRPTLWRTCRVIANESRLRLLWMIFDLGDLSVSQLGRNVGISDQNASIQLRLINSRGLISPRRVGMEVIYEAEPNTEVAAAPEILEALRECRAKKVPMDVVIRAATAFTHPRRIQIVRELAASALKPAQLQDRTGIKERALYRHLSKLEARGFIRRIRHTYSVCSPKNEFSKILLQLALSVDEIVSEPMTIAKVISGGQTGADRAALDAAIACGVPCGGWCPKGRLAEDGPIPKTYPLQETDSAQYPVRTRMNVEEADVTIILSRGPLTGGSLLTLAFAKAADKPCVHIDLLESQDVFQGLEKVEGVVPRIGKTILNVAGPRASNDPKIYDAVYQAIVQLLRKEP